MIKHKSSATLHAELETVDAAIAAHPLSSESVKNAHEVIEAIGKENKELVEQELAARSLPGLEELGRIQLRGTASWLKLRNKRYRVVKKIDKLAK